MTEAIELPLRQPSGFAGKAVGALGIARKGMSSCCATYRLRVVCKDIGETEKNIDRVFIEQTLL